MGKDVTFIYPGIVGCGFNSFGESVDSSWISHGLSLLSACLKKENLTVDLIDLRRLRSWEEFEKEIKEKNRKLSA